MAKQFGVSEQIIERLANWKDNEELFDERERVTLEFTEVMSNDSNNVSNHLWARLKQHFDDGEIIELACVIGTFNYFNRFNNALKVDVTK